MSDRNAARAIGICCIIGTVSGILVLSLQQGDLSAPDPAAAVAARSTAITASALLTLLMAVALAAVPVLLHPVLARWAPRSATGYIVARAAEALIYCLDVIALLVLLRMALEADGALPPLVGDLVLAVRDAAGHGVLDVAIFPIGALVVNAAMLRCGLIPRWLAIWGVLGALAYLGAGIGVLLGLPVFSPGHLALSMPLALEEMVFAVWMIVRGFSRPTLPEQPAQGAPAGNRREAGLM